MSVSSPRVRILVIQPWTVSLAPLRAALRGAGIVATVTRVDLEPALNAALGRGGKLDVIIHDSRTPGVSRDVVEARLREHRQAIPIIALQAVDQLVEAVRAAITSRQN